jgi:hypothetical protein
VAISQNIKILEKYIEADGVDNFTEQAIKKLIRHSLQKEQRDLQELTDELKVFEEKYNMQSEEFHKRFHHGVLGDDEDLFVWDAKLEMSKEISKRIRILE